MKTNSRIQEFEFLKQNPLLQLPKRRLQTVGVKIRCANVEETIKNIRFERRILDFIEPQNGDRTIQSKSSLKSFGGDLISREDIMNRYKQKEDFDLKKEQRRGLTQSEQKDGRKKLQLQLDFRIQLLNQLSPLDQQWHSPFTLTEPQRYQHSSVQSIINKLGNKIDCLQPKNKEVSTSFAFNRILKDESEENLVIAAIQVNQVLMGYGPKLHSVLDRTKGDYFNGYGNPKYLLRSNHLIGCFVIYNESGRLDMIKEWNKLLKMEKLRPSTQQIKKKALILMQQPTESSRQNGTLQFQNFQEFHSKISYIVAKAQNTNRPSQQRMTPQSSVLPQLIVRNSSNSQSSTQKDLLQLDMIGEGETAQILIQNGRATDLKTNPQDNFDYFDEVNNQIKNDTFVSKETFLTFCKVFWNVVRKEDEIVERVAQALLTNKTIITFKSFCLFHSIFIFQDCTQVELQGFVFSFFMDQKTSITFIKVQGLLQLLFNRIDSQTVTTKLVDQMLEKILEKIHRPSAISSMVLQELLQEQSIPSELIIRLIYDC